MKRHEAELDPSPLRPGAAAGGVLGLALGAATRELAGTLGMAVLGALIGFRAARLVRPEGQGGPGGSGRIPRRRAVPAQQVRS